MLGSRGKIIFDLWNFTTCYIFVIHNYRIHRGVSVQKKKNSVVLVRTGTIPIERPQPVGEVSANFS
jgi:hypothetical protein